MKLSPSLLVGALSLAGLSSAVQAQSVTLYGLVDVGLARVSRAPWTVTNNATSRLGVRGKEDLGDGLKAMYQLETEIQADEGDSAEPFWGRQAWVGLGSNYGDLRLGRTKNLVDDIANDIDPFETNGVIGDFTKKIWRGGVMQARISDALVYNTRNMAGFKVATQYVLDERNDAGGHDGWGATASYESKLGGVSAGYERPVVGTDAKVGAAQGQAGAIGGWLNVGQLVDIGELRLSAGYSNADTHSSKGKNKGWLVGAQYTIDAVKLKAVYGVSDNEAVKSDVLVETNTVRVIGVGADYVLSPRTLVYAMGGKNKPNATTVPSVVTNMLQFGVTHRF